jgi:3-oxoacyl-[acyl-carrier protein] reductase
MQYALRDAAFQDQVVIVTGAASGIGNAVATHFAHYGALVVMLDMDEGSLKEAAAEIQKSAGGAVDPVVAKADVSDEESVARAVGLAIEAGGHINGAVNVAGITRDSRITKKTVADFDLVFAVHVRGTFLVSREVANQDWHPLFKANGNAPLSDGQNRFITNFSSVTGRSGNAGQVDYTGAKGAIEAMTRTTAREFASYGARINAVAPGPVDTPMLAAVPDEIKQGMARSTLLGRIATPTDLANGVCTLSDSIASGFVTGQVWQHNGGMFFA